MSDHEELLGQLSGQLALAAHRSPTGQSTNRPSPPPAGQWTQYGGVPSDKCATSVRSVNLCNSMNLSACIPLSSSPADVADSASFLQAGESGRHDGKLTYFEQDDGLAYGGHSDNLAYGEHDDNLTFVGHDNLAYVRHDDSLAQTDFPWYRKQPLRFSLSGSSSIDSPRQRVQSFDEYDSQIDQRKLETIDNDVFQYDRISFTNGHPIQDYSPPLSAVSHAVNPDMQFRTSVSSLPDVSIRNPNDTFCNPHDTIRNPHTSIHNQHQSIDNLYLKSEHMYPSCDTFSSSSQDGWPYSPAFEAVSARYQPDVSHLFTSSTASALGKHISGDTQPSHFSLKSSAADLDNLDVYGKISLDLGTAVSGSSRWSLDSYSLTSKVNRCNSETDLRHSNFLDSGILSSLNNLHSRNTQVQTLPFNAPRPSYSDIAKTPKTRSKFEARIGAPSVKISSGSVGVKPPKQDKKLPRPAVKRTLSGPNFLPRASQAVDGALSPVAPSSRYGLDNFDEQMDDVKSHHNSSSGSADHMAGSNSCVTSSGSTHDISAPEARPVKMNDDGNQRRQASRNSITTKNGSGSALDKPSLRKKGSKVHSEDGVTDHLQGFSQMNEDHGALSASSSDTVLNNGKPTVNKSTSKLLSSTHQPDYINNNLRDVSKLTNQTAAKACQWLGSCKMEDQYKQKESKTNKRYGAQSGGSCHDRSKSRDSGGKNHAGSLETDGTWRKLRLLAALDTDRFDTWCAVVTEKLVNYGNLGVTSMFNFATYILGIILHLASSVMHMFLLLVTSMLTHIKERFFKSYLGTETGKPQRGNVRKRIGLDDNITLPTTGEEAIKRLLSCKGKDPYSILGLRTDTSDEDIKKYYRKQAVLVHPDKNQEPGAEDAFKILGHAFKMIGDPVKRKQYDGHTQEAQELQAMRKFAEMLSKLQTKIQEAANMMYCDVCGGKHRRVPVDRPFYSARFCQQCNARHSAKAGDIWAESTMLGFYWHYFALLDGHVFDITDWMKCHKEYFKHMKANSHTVTYKLATDGTSRHHHTGGAKLQDFMNCLFKASSTTAQGHNPSWNSTRADKWTQAASSTSTASKNIHHKKRHL